LRLREKKGGPFEVDQQLKEKSRKAPNLRRSLNEKEKDGRMRERGAAMSALRRYYFRLPEDQEEKGTDHLAARVMKRRRTLHLHQQKKKFADYCNEKGNV